jgi:eukaryotic-like serine/threonine-protein kinase
MSEQKRQWSGQSVAGRYSLGNYLGGTEHSAVFATEIVHARAQRVAIKLIPAGSVDINLQLGRWKRLSTLSHPNLLKILDYGKCELDGDAHLYVVMEYADEDLADILPQRALNAEETRGMMEPVIETLAFLHEQNLVHTRMHPGNILATGDQIKLSSDSISPKGEPIGFAVSAEGFSPPEWGGGKADPAEDVWSLGATVVAALTQRPPKFGENGEPLLPVEVSEPFAGIAQAALNKDPAHRILVAGIRLKLNPGSAPAEEAPKEPAKTGPVAVPVSKVSPPVVAERRVPAPVAARPMRAIPSPRQKKSYVLPVTVAAIVLILLLALPKLFRQKSDAAPPEATNNSSTAGNPSAAKPVSSSKIAISTPKKSAPPAPELTETSQPAPAAKPSAPPVKSASKTAAGGATRGEVLDQVLPDVSDKARGTIRGTVRISVRARVNRAGTVDSAELDSPSSSRYFSDQVIKAAKRWQFSAPEVNGRSVESEWLLHFEITPAATKVRSTQVSP